MTTFVFRRLVERLAVTILVSSLFEFCPHVLGYAGALRTAVQLALDHAGSQVFSCDRCPTDYLVTAQEDQLTVRLWQDLGTGISPTDPYWRSHVDVKGENDSTHAPRFLYKHGSVRDLYTQDMAVRISQPHRRVLQETIA